MLPIHAQTTNGRWATMATLLVLIAAVFSPPGAPDAHAGEWPYPDELRSRLVWVHPLVNYAIHPVWQRQWERHLQQGVGLQFASGSVSTEDLATDLVINLSEPLNDAFRLVYRGVWREGLHLDTSREEHFIGLEMAVAGKVAVHLQVNPTPDKEEFDLLAGLTLTDTTRERYLKLSLRLDDFMYEQKNDQGGESGREAVGLQWEGRYASGRWEVFSAGRYGSESHRRYPDPALSPTVAEFSQQDGGSRSTLRYLLGSEEFVQLAVLHYRFTAAEVRRDSLAGYDYANEFVHLAAVGIIELSGPWWLRPELHWLRQWTSAAGRRDIEHRREDFFPALFVELHAPGKSVWELGYLATHHQWEHMAGDHDLSRDGYTDKLKLGWTYAFKPTARIQFSLSHELDLDRFGGGCIQFQGLF